MAVAIAPNEREKIQKRHHEKFIWTRFGTVFLGLWLLASPETFGYLNSLYKYNDWVCGLLLIFFGFLSMSYRYRHWIWASCLVGIWLQFAPLAFWANEPVMYVTDTLIGVLAIAFCVLIPIRPPELDLGPQIPPGWTYNPSSWHQRIPVVFLATICWFLARYLTSFQLHYIHTVWDPFFGMGTEKVITSMISQEFPVPDAGLGALAYSLEAIMGVKGGARRWHTMPWIVLTFGFLVVPVGFVSIILVMLQPIAVGAWCGICLIIAACMLVMLALSVDEVIATLQFLKGSKREGKSLLKTLFLGSKYSDTAVDTRTPSFHASPWKILKASTWGITIPWNLVITALIGVWILFFNEVLGVTGFLAKNADVCGALIVTFSIISFAEVIRPIRFLNIPMAAWFGIAPWIFSESTMLVKIHCIVVAALVIVLSLPRGRIKERYGDWDRKIF